MKISTEHKELIGKYIAAVDIKAEGVDGSKSRVTVSFKTNVDVNGEEWRQLQALLLDKGNGLDIGNQMPLLERPAQTHTVAASLQSHRLDTLMAIKAEVDKVRTAPEADVSDSSYVGIIDSASREVGL